MRTIKFRGRCKKSGDLVYGDFIHGVGWKKGCFYILPRSENLAYVKHCDPLDGVMIDPESTGQFTGIHDKNGKEIYEGDIVRVDCSPVGGSFEDGVYRVAYLIPDCAFVLEQLDGQSGIGFNECYIYEVIGNIHENSELLNQ